MRYLQCLWKDESGQTVIEYVVIVLVILGAAVVLFTGVGTRISEMLRSLLSMLNLVPTTPAQ